MTLEIREAPSQDLVYSAGSREELIEWAGYNLDPHLLWYYDVLEDGVFVNDLDRFIKGEGHE